MLISKKDLANEIKNETGFTQKDILEVLRVANDVIMEHMKNNDEVKISEDIKFVGKAVGERRYKTVFAVGVIPPCTVPKVKFSKRLKEYIK